MKILMNNKVLFISVLIYMILAIFLPLPKPEFVPSTNFVPIWSFLYGYGQSIIIGITLVITVVMCFNDKVDEYLNRLVSIKWTYIATYLIMIATMILFVVEIPGLWWSWTTIGFLVVMVLLAPIILKDIIPKIDALLMGAGVAYFIMGAWETPYQYGLWKYYEASQGLSFMGILGNLEFNLPFVLMGLSIVTFIALILFRIFIDVYVVRYFYPYLSLGLLTAVIFVTKLPRGEKYFFVVSFISIPTEEEPASSFKVAATPPLVGSRMA